MPIGHISLKRAPSAFVALCVWQFGHFHLCGGTVCWLIISWEWTPNLDFEPLISKHSFTHFKEFLWQHQDDEAQFCKIFSKYQKSCRSQRYICSRFLQSHHFEKFDIFNLISRWNNRLLISETNVNKITQLLDVSE